MIRSRVRRFALLACKEHQRDAKHVHDVRNVVPVQPFIAVEADSAGEIRAARMIGWIVCCA